MFISFGDKNMVHCRMFKVAAGNGKLSIEVIFATRSEPCQWPFHSRLDGSKLNILYIIDEEQYHARSAELGVSSKLANTLWDGVRMLT